MAHAHTTPAANTGRRGLPLELMLVIGLPLMSMFIGGAIIITAYSHGFTVIPESASHATAR
ncbi:MAG: hypothetical protein M0Q15_08225 [Nevskia sp.]|jgi:hypothetical protein|nr:hypothetical protein [Nevskia sp.]